MSKNIKIFVLGFAATIGFAQSVAAYCPEPMLFGRPSLAEQVNSQLNWMLCLHNEQVGSLNRHADQINSLSESMSGLAGLIRMEGDRVDSIVIRERDDFEERRVLLQRISDLEQRIATLERLLTEQQ